MEQLTTFIRRVYIFNFSMLNNNAAGMAWSFLTLKLQGVCMDMHLYMCTCMYTRTCYSVHVCSARLALHAVL